MDSGRLKAQSTYYAIRTCHISFLHKSDDMIFVTCEECKTV